METSRREMGHELNEIKVGQREAEVATQVRAQLANSSYFALRRVLCECRDGIVTLRGQVPSYFLKQIAQTLVGTHLSAAVRIENRLEVVYSQSQ